MSSVFISMHNIASRSKEVLIPVELLGKHFTLMNN
jgi:hypothetical protein